MEVVNALGRRKSAIARIFVSEGTGKSCCNSKYNKHQRSYKHTPERNKALIQLYLAK